MPIAISFHPDQHLAHISMSGPIDVASLRTALQQLFADARFRPGMNRLWDFRASTVQLTSDEIRQIIALARQHHPNLAGGRLALVMGTTLAYGLGRMYQIYAELAEIPTDIEVFRTLEGAALWLNSVSERDAAPEAG